MRQPNNNDASFAGKHGNKVIGVLVDRNRAYGRRICEGIASYVTQRGGWSLKAIPYSERDGYRGCDAFIARVVGSDIRSRLEKTGKPVVDVYCALPCPRFSRVDGDQVETGRLAAEFLLGHRFPHFAYCGYDGVKFSDERKVGFVDELKQFDFDCHVYPTPERASADFSRYVIRNERLAKAVDAKQMRAWVRRLPKPIAVFCSHDLRAYQLAQLCVDAGIRIPQDVALLGVDDDALACTFSSVAISSIDPNAFEVGRRAAELLDEWMSRPGAGVRESLVVPIGTTERLSTEIYPMSPPWLSDALVFIHRNYHRPITACDVYAYLGMSHTPVDRAFRVKLNTSVQREISSVRMEEACRLLRQTDIAIGAIAHRTGFSSQEYFSHSFTTRYGIPPSDYRSREMRKSHINIQNKQMTLSD